MPGSIDPDCAITLVAGTDLEAETAALSDSLTGGGTVTDVYLAGIADAKSADSEPGLRVLVHQRYGRGVPTERSRLSSPSTRWAGLAQLTDLTPTILAAAGVTPPGDVVGTRIADDGRRGSGASDTVRDIRALVTTSERASSGAVAGWTALVIAGLTAIAVIAAVRIRNARGGSRAVGRGAIAGGLAFVAWVPLTTYLSKLIPLGTLASPGVQITVSTLALAAIGAAVLILWLGRHPRHAGLLGVLVISAVTAGILGLDTLTGGSLQRATPFGNDPVLGGRFYGIRNLTFGLFAAGVLLAVCRRRILRPSTCRGQRQRKPRRRGRRQSRPHAGRPRGRRDRSRRHPAGRTSRHRRGRRRHALAHSRRAAARLAGRRRPPHLAAAAGRRGCGHRRVPRGRRAGLLPAGQRPHPHRPVRRPGVRRRGVDDHHPQDRRRAACRRPARGRPDSPAGAGGHRNRRVRAGPVRPPAAGCAGGMRRGGR